MNSNDFLSMSAKDLEEDVDPDYATFLKNLSQRDHSSFAVEMLNEEDGSLTHINYDNDEEEDDQYWIQPNRNHVKQESDEENIEAEKDGNTSSKLKHEEEKKKARVSQTCQVQHDGEYRKKIAEVLSKPFDIDEYNQLYDDATKHGETEVSNTNNNVAPSYLDLYPGEPMYNIKKKP